MKQIVNSLHTISKSYTEFERDQVLTEKQLNSITAYLDPQDRLSRVNLFGVGIATGLQIGATASRVRLEPGYGVTTDGDLICERLPVEFSQFREYGLEAPKYDPLYRTETKMFPAWELTRVGESIEGGKPISSFTAETSLNLRDMSAILLVESYVKDNDLCTLDDCDNIGKDRLCSVKLIVLESTSLDKLQSKLPSPGLAQVGINPLSSKRVLGLTKLDTPEKLQKAYLDTCNSMHKTLLDALPLLFRHYRSSVSGVFDQDPNTKWNTLLKKYQQAFKSNPVGVQYYHGFLCDLVSVWNELCRSAPRYFSQVCPSVDAFPKHLLLGSLSGKNVAQTNRSEFYPTKIDTADGDDSFFQFLIQKLDAMIGSFASTDLTVGRDIRVTPSQPDPQISGVGAIPFYYEPTTKHPIHQFWNFDLSKHQRSRMNFSYHGDKFSATGNAADPLSGRISDYSVFRVEGHISEQVVTALPNIEEQIRQFNLPFSVTSVYLGKNKTKVKKKKGVIYDDLHRLHYLLRQDASHQLDDVTTFSSVHKTNITQAIANNLVSDDSPGNDGTKVSEISKNRDSEISQKAGKVKESMQVNYVEFVNNSAWKENMSGTMEAAGRYKYDLGKVTKTEFATPFDALIQNTQVNWLPWLEILINDKEEKEEEKLFFTKLAKINPDLDHTGGVVRGGTLVLVYDDSGKVIADFMTSGLIPEPERIENPKEPPLPKPGIRPEWILENGAIVNPSRDKFFDQKIVNVRSEIDKSVDAKVNVQSKFVSAFKDSFTIYSNTLTKPGKFTAPIGAGSLIGSEGVLGTVSNKTSATMELIDALREQQKDSSLTNDERVRAAKRAGEAESQLSKDVVSVAQILSEEKSDVRRDTDGGIALEGVSFALEQLSSNQSERNKAITGLKKVANTTENSALKVGLLRLIG